MEYFTSGKFYESLVVVFIGVVFLTVGHGLDNKYLKPKAGNTTWYRSTKMIMDFVESVFVILLVLAILSINGVKVGKYVTSLGVIGVVASFALQDILKDLIMGLSIMFEGFFKVDDIIKVEGRPAKVLSFNIKTTRLMMIDDDSIRTVSNRYLSDIALESDWVDIDVPIGYDVDLHESRNLCKKCARRIGEMASVSSCEFLNTQELGESAILYKIRIHCAPDKKYPVRRAAIAAIQDVFYEHKVSFPYNVLVLQNGDK